MRKLLPLFILSVLNIHAIAQSLNQISSVDKLYGLSNYWQEVNYNFVYFNKLDKTKWNDSYKTLLAKVDNLDDFQYYLELQKLSALLNDGHTQVYMPGYLQDQLVHGEFGNLKFYTTLIEGKVIVARVSTKSKNILPIGTEIIKVNGQGVQEYIDEKVKPYLSVSSQHVKNTRAAQLLFRNRKGSAYHIECKTPAGKLRNLDLILSSAENKDMYPHFPEVNTFSSKWLNNGIYYMKFLSFDKAEVYNDMLKILPDLKRAKGVIIDVRYNGGGSSAVSRKIAQHFIKDSVFYGARNESRLIIPTDRALGSFLTAQDTVEGKKDWGLNKEETLMYYKSARGYLYHKYPSSPIKISANVEKVIVPTIILTGSNTASAAEDFLIYTDNQNHIKRIGEFTNGSTGQPLTVGLPNGGEAWICTKKVTLPDGTEFIGMGIAPDIKAEFTLKDLIKNEDSVLNNAVKELKLRLIN